MRLDSFSYGRRNWNWKKFNVQCFDVSSVLETWNQNRKRYDFQIWEANWKSDFVGVIKTKW